MADRTPIQPYLNEIQNAIYGEYVRSAIISAIETCFDNTADGKTTADTAAQAVIDASGQATGVLSNLNDAIEDADTAKSNLNARITVAETTQSTLDGRITVAETTQSTLNSRITVAGTTQTSLNGRITVAETTQSNLNGTITAAETAESSLDGKIAVADDSESELTSLITQAETVSNSLSRIIIRGTAFETLQDLQDAQQTGAITDLQEGDCFNVGTVAPYMVYRWTGSTFENQGQAQGVTRLPNTEIDSIWNNGTFDETVTKYLTSTGVKYLVYDIIKPEIESTDTKIITAATTTAFDSLTTETKTVVGSINELNARSLWDSVGVAGSDKYNYGGFHNSVYRGKNLGTEITAEQYEAISSGLFTDMFIGDYWNIGDANYRIADFNYFLKTGTTSSGSVGSITSPHIVIIPDRPLGSAQMNSTNITTGGYLAAELRTSEEMANIKATIIEAFGSSHILSHDELLTNAVTNGVVTGLTWVAVDIEIPSEIMLFGQRFNSNEPNLDDGIGSTQFNLFRYRRDLLVAMRNNCWLRDVVNSTQFAASWSTGRPYVSNASTSRGIRPYFAIY